MGELLLAGFSHPPCDQITMFVSLILSYISSVSCAYNLIQAYTVLESTTDSVFLHLTMSDRHDAEFGNILKSNSNGTFYGVSLEHVNRNGYGFVDFEKMIGLDGIALVNVVANPDEALLTGHKALQTRITHNDGKGFHEMTLRIDLFFKVEPGNHLLLQTWIPISKAILVPLR